jgi:succinate-semialdehyde dehydrogenase/glutarate-semialdehyde dehydrogenase
MPFASINPNDGATLKTFPELTDRELEGRLARAAAAYASWKTTSYAQRALVVSRAAALMRADIDRFAMHATTEMGKLIGEARAEVRFSASILDYYADHAERFLAPVKLDPAHGEAHMESSPTGVIYCVEPWNFPYYQLARVAGPQLMAGNVLVVKHAESVPQCALAFEQLWADAGAPAGLYTNLFVSHAQSDGIIDDPRVAGVALTGGAKAGQAIAARAGRNLKPASMELGGADAFIVLDDADLEKTIPWAVWGRMYNAGQTCCAAKRFIVVDAIADQFLARYRAAIGALTPGDPMDERTTHGPVCSEPALVRLLGQVDAAVSHGARVVVGGHRMDRAGSFMEATILTDVSPANPAFRDEFFGPVAMFFRVADEDAAVALANDSDFGLGGSVFTGDTARGLRVASRIDTGMVFVNNMDWTDAELPFGGIKHSGYGRELGDMGIQAFVNKKMVRVRDMAAPRV